MPCIQKVRRLAGSCSSNGRTVRTFGRPTFIADDTDPNREDCGIEPSYFRLQYPLVDRLTMLLASVAMLRNLKNCIDVIRSVGATRRHTHDIHGHGSEYTPPVSQVLLLWQRRLDLL